MSLLPFIASSKPPAPAVTPPSFRSRSNGTTTGTLTAAITMPAGFQAGDLLIASVSGSRGVGTAFTTSMPGWTKIFEVGVTAGTIMGVLSVYAKVATGSETTTTWSLNSGNTVKSWICEAWVGTAGLPEAVTGVGNTLSGQQTLVSNTVTVTTPGSIVLTTLGLRTFAGGIDAVWGGGAAAAYDTDSGNTAPVYNAIQQVDTGQVTHQASFSNTQGAPAQEIGSIVLKPAA